MSYDKMTSITMYTQIAGTILGVTVGVTALTSALFLQTNQSFKPKIQPSNGAFSIWSLIFLTSFIHSVYTAVDKRDVTNKELFLTMGTVICQSIAYLLSSLWVPYWSSEKYKAGALIILLAFISSTASVAFDAIHFQTKESFGNEKWLEVFCRRAAVALLSSWLLIASYISQTFNNKNLDSDWAIVWLSIIASCISAFGAQPFSVFPVIWAILFSLDGRPITPLLVALSISLLGGSIGTFFVVRKN